MRGTCFKSSISTNTESLAICNSSLSNNKLTRLSFKSETITHTSIHFVYTIFS